MDLDWILRYARDLALPVVILIIVVSIAFRLYFLEKKDHKQTSEKLNALYHRLEERLWHEVDELEKLLREERTRLK